MTSSEFRWWELLADDEKIKVETWDSLTTNDYVQAGRTFDLFSFKYEDPDPQKDTDDKEYKRREKQLLELSFAEERELPTCMYYI